MLKKAKSNILRNLLIVLAFGFPIIGCNNRPFQSLQKTIIDAGPFSVNTPSNFKLVTEKGIDSYVGKISNGKIEFSFDYGWYSNRGPLTYYDYADKYLFKLYADEILTTCNLTDSLYQKIRANPIILDAKRNPKFPNESDKEILTTISLGVGTCTIPVLDVTGVISQNYKTHIITETINNIQRRKQFYPNTNKYKSAGVYIENLEEKRDDKYGYNKLSFSTNNFNEKNSKMILEILESVKLNKTGKK